MLKCEFQPPSCNQDACIDARVLDALNMLLFLAYDLYHAAGLLLSDAP
jgi:hypothetical protein